MRLGEEADRHKIFYTYHHVYASSRSDEDPGMSTADLRTAGQVLGAAALFFSFGSSIALVSGSIRNWLALIIGLGLPACIISILWLKLALSNRRWLSRRQTSGDGLRNQLEPILEKDVTGQGAVEPGQAEAEEEVISESNPMGRDRHLEMWLGIVWAP